MTCVCARHLDGSVTTFICPVHASVDPCLTMAQCTGRRRKGTIHNGVCSHCGWGTPPAPVVVELHCDMKTDCVKPITMIDESGFIYCTDHGLSRRSWKYCRKLRPFELNRLKRGETVKRY
jgi:hypothetical protein